MFDWSDWWNAFGVRAGLGNDPEMPMGFGFGNFKPPKFKIGDKVQTDALGGTIVSVFKNTSNQDRVVVECATTGTLTIFDPEAITKAK